MVALTITHTFVSLVDNGTDTSLVRPSNWNALHTVDTTALDAALALKAPLASPVFTDIPTAPTAAPATNTQQIATCAFVLANGGGTGEALTKTDDTNVTLTLGGSATTALVHAASITVGWAGELAVPRGGTGLASTTAYAVLCGGTTSTSALQSIASVGSTGQVLTSNGAGALPTFQAAVGTVPPQGRLTLTSGVAITTADVTGALIVYYTPAIGSLIPIYNGSSFLLMSFAQLSNDTAQSSTGKAGPAVVGNNLIYDLFVWNDSGTLRLTRGPAWTTDKLRGTGVGTTEIQLVNGVWTNVVAITNGPGAGLGTLVGSVRSNGSAQLVDSKLFRWVSNIYNVALRPMFVIDTTASWNYTTATFRQANATAANQLDFLQSVGGNPLSARVQGNYSNTVASNYGIVGIDLDTINTTTLVSNINTINYVPNGGQLVVTNAIFYGFPGAGRTFAIWKEYSAAVGAGTFYGTGGGPILQSGISGEIFN